MISFLLSKKRETKGSRDKIISFFSSSEALFLNSNISHFFWKENIFFISVSFQLCAKYIPYISFISSKSDKRVNMILPRGRERRVTPSNIPDTIETI